MRKQPPHVPAWRGQKNPSQEVSQASRHRAGSRRRFTASSHFKRGKSEAAAVSGTIRMWIHRTLLGDGGSTPAAERPKRRCVPRAWDAGCPCPFRFSRPVCQTRVLTAKAQQFGDENAVILPRTHFARLNGCRAAMTCSLLLPSWWMMRAAGRSDFHPAALMRRTNRLLST